MAATLPSPEYYAFRAAAHVFSSELYEPQREPKNSADSHHIDRLPFDYASAQERLREAQIHRRPHRARIFELIDGNRPLPKLLIATHVLPELQPAAATWIEQRAELRDVVKVALATSGPAFNIRDVGFGDAMDALLLSIDGESLYPLKAAEAFVIGGYEEACLVNSMYDLLMHSGRAGLTEITVHLMTQFTYARRKDTYAKILYDLDASPTELEARIDALVSQMAVEPNSLTRLPGTEPRIKVSLIDWNRFNGRTNLIRASATMNLIIE